MNHRHSRLFERSLPSLIVVASIAIALTLRGQDAASTPFRATPAPEEQTAPAPQPAETPAPTPTPAPSASAEPQVQRATTPEPTVARAIAVTPRPSVEPVRAISPRPATTPRATPNASAAAQPQASPREAGEAANEAGDNVSDTIKRLESEWESAISKHDTATINRVVAEDFVGVSSNGRIGDKQTLISEAKRDKSAYKTASARQMRVYSYGSKVAVVLGVTKESGTTASGRPFDHTYRFTDTWMERNGKWQCIAAHAAVATRR